MNEMNVIVKTTAELEEEDMKNLISLKQQYWKYPEKEQMRWFNENIRAEDYHIMIHSPYRGGVSFSLPKCS